MACLWGRIVVFKTGIRVGVLFEMDEVFFGDVVEVGLAAFLFGNIFEGGTVVRPVVWIIGDSHLLDTAIELWEGGLT